MQSLKAFALDTVSEGSKGVLENLKLSEDKSVSTASSNQEKMATETEELKASPELTSRHYSAPQLLCPVTNVQSQESLPAVPDQSINKGVRAQSVPDFSSEPVSNPNLRKQVVLQLVKYLQKKYDLNQEAAREKTILIERKIRLSSPEMKEEYKKRYNLFIELIKV